jgi:rhamnogalacturonan endolyase
MVKAEWSKKRVEGASTARKVVTAWIVALAICSAMARANAPGGVTGSGPEVSVRDNRDGTVTMSNGLVSIVIVTKTARLNEVKFTHHNGEGTQTSNVLMGKGQYYYGGFNLGTTEYQYSLAVDPQSNGGQYADVMLLSDSQNKGVMEVHFSMLRASPGFYSTAIMTHRKQDAAANIIAWGIVTRVPGDFNWVSADPMRSFLIGVPTKSGVKVPNAPHEITVNLSGSQQGEYADKFIFGQDHADLKAWGWSSVGQGGANVGAWMMTTMEFSDGGPLKRDVSVYPYSELNNSILTNEVGMGSDGHLVDGEAWKKTCGPWFIPSLLPRRSMMMRSSRQRLRNKRGRIPGFKIRATRRSRTAARSPESWSSMIRVIRIRPSPAFGWDLKSNRKPVMARTIFRSG